jgi:Skp family chaperone for outer membrane proteins
MRAAVAAVFACVMIGSMAAGVSAQPAATPATGPSSIKIGYIDVQRVLARSAAGVAAREQLEKMTADARRDKQEQFDRKRRDAARAADDYQKELEKREATLLQKVLQEMGGIIERVGKEKNYFMIVEKRNAGVLYATADADLTDEVIRAYDREAGSKKK